VPDKNSWEGRIQRKILAALGLAALGVWTAQSRSAIADDRPTIPVIVKDTTSFYWQIVLAGARAAGKELKVNVPELGAQSEGDVAGQISILENAVAGKPAAIVISPTQFSGLGKPIDQAAKSTKVIGIDGTADTKSFTAFLGTDNIAGGAAAADALAKGVKQKTGNIEGDIAVLTNIAGQDSGDRRVKGFIDRAIDKSLRRLQTDSVDLYLSHWPDTTVTYEETLGAYDKLLKKGKVRFVGVSNLDDKELRKALDTADRHKLPRYQVLQPEYNHYDRSSFEGQLCDLCIKEGLSVVTYFSASPRVF
jgi:DNA-binding LacI/PurR family transcriptional regulator